MAQNPGIVPIHFAEGEGFRQEVAANVGCRKGSDKLLKLIDKTLKGISQEEARPNVGRVPRPSAGIGEAA